MLIITMKNDEKGLMFLEEADTVDDLKRLLLDRNKQWTQKGFITTTTNGSLRTLVVSCVDSRVQVENIFQAKPGELLVLKNAGNFTKFVIRSIVIAILELGVKNIVILGHEYCGMAVKDKARIAHFLEKVGDERLKEIETIYKTKPVDWFGFFNYGEWDKNVREQVKIINELLDKFVPEELQPTIIPAVYDLDTGEVEFLK
jgi:carbonic anhydrase